MSHKHAEVLRAIADGASFEEFEVRAESWTPHEWADASGDGTYTGWITSPDRWEIRRKPKYIMVNGFKVPKPLDVMPSDGDVYCAATSGTAFYSSGDPQYQWAPLMLTRGCLHSTKEAAIAHAKAMLGIDPEAL